MNDWNGHRSCSALLEVAAVAVQSARVRRASAAVDRARHRSIAGDHREAMLRAWPAPPYRPPRAPPYGGADAETWGRRPRSCHPRLGCRRRLARDQTAISQDREDLLKALVHALAIAANRHFRPRRRLIRI